MPAPVVDWKDLTTDIALVIGIAIFKNITIVKTHTIRTAHAVDHDRATSVEERFDVLAWLDLTEPAETEGMMLLSRLHIDRCAIQTPLGKRANSLTARQPVDARGRMHGKGGTLIQWSRCHLGGNT